MKILEGHSPDRHRPLAGYAALSAVYTGATGAFAVWFRRSGRPLPDHMAGRDLALATVATHKLARIIAKDRVTSELRAPFTRFQGDTGHGEVAEAARGRGLRRAVGELLICPYCLSVWFATAFAAGLLVAPRATRQVMAVLSAVFGADALQLAYARAEKGV